MKESVRYHAPDISNVQAKIVIEKLKENALIKRNCSKHKILKT